jgi:hypothetical protein
MKKYISFILENKKTDINIVYNKYYNNIDRNVFEKIISTDPTSLINNKLYVGKYSKWLLNLFIKGDLKLEDLYKATEYLSIFDRLVLKNSISKKDINNYNSLSDLFKTISQFKQEDLMSNKELKDDCLVEEFENFKLYIPKTYKDSCILGKGTEWCTATEKTDKWYRKYHKPGKELLIFISKLNPKEKIQKLFREEILA